MADGTQNLDSASTVLSRLREFLDSQDVDYRVVEHAATRTSEESARARGEELRVGGKALVLRVDSMFQLYVLPADRRLDAAAVKRWRKAKKIRFATPEELREQTGLVPGSVPPFGHPVLPYELFADSSFRQQERIAFNAGSLTTSFVLKMGDYLRMAEPTIFEFAEPPVGEDG